MRRVMELLEMELEIFCAVVSYRIRSLVLLAAASALPPVLKAGALRVTANPQAPELAQAVHTIVGLIALALMLGLLLLAIQTYLKDRAALLGF